MKKFLLLATSLLAVNVFVFAQDDELPPPSSRPKAPTTEDRSTEEFQGFRKPKKIDLSKFIIEPNVNLSFSSNNIAIGLSPYLGYRVWKGLSLGGGVTYFYNRYSNVAFGVNGSTQRYYANINNHIYGGGVFAQYDVWKGLFARVKFEVLQVTGDDYNNASLVTYPNGKYEIQFPKLNKTYPGLFIGAGYNLLRSKNFFFPLMVSYNVLYPLFDKTYSPYPRGLVVQLGFINVF